MLIKETLFSKGRPTSGRPGLADVLRHQEERIVREINAISSLEELTDAYLGRLVKRSLVEPIVVRFEEMTHDLRTEQIDAAFFPPNYNVYPGKSYPKQVARIAIPFTGETDLFEFCPNESRFNSPRGRILGQSIQFDIILWGGADDAHRVEEQVKSNRENIEWFVQRVNNQVRAYNEALPPKVKAAFEAKLEELTQQHDIFDTLGIKKSTPYAPVEATPTAAPAQPKKKSLDKATHIIQYVENLYVKQFHQTNHNQGDVNNAIQSNQ